MGISPALTRKEGYAILTVAWGVKNVKHYFNRYESFLLDWTRRGFKDFFLVGDEYLAQYI